ncbi:hypothetical protein [Candidatus Poriferisocius sp.]|uniref:hypothetical protein n=1 Tax=Candidatus Poriferisocius sp. TaxID=3101276 RepID=UPI003B01B95B
MVEPAGKKSRPTDTREFQRRDIGRIQVPGNSACSDIEPLVDIGGQNVPIPYHLAWDLDPPHSR